MKQLQSIHYISAQISIGQKFNTEVKAAGNL
ncbi:hypothetical protein PEPS_44420 (plasmid) [Persicobacter psychrovividus]|uniref:Uncharacterized protein n=1 Tax=Persicobacter psychrovividus TaxID=387638 RepID=A0ABM7VMG2_9BACT|nr:hypothetical protein PEPS_44420 [Persicobacter psychrovividus]